MRFIIPLKKDRIYISSRLSTTERLSTFIMDQGQVIVGCGVCILGVDETGLWVLEKGATVDVGDAGATVFVGAGAGAEPDAL
jgi:hypothetical protein